MKVYVLAMMGEDNDTHVLGVFATRQAAMDLAAKISIAAANVEAFELLGPATSWTDDDDAVPGDTTA